jgi:hypothetical protein
LGAILKFYTGQMVRYTIIIFSILKLLSNTIYGQDEIPKYFPEYSFDCDSSLDLTGNRYWSNWLISFKKPSIYQDTLFTEYYRLIYFGKYFSIVSIHKISNDYILVSDSLNWQNKSNAVEYRDIVFNENDLKFIDTLKALSLELHDYRSYENCTDDKTILFLDDRDSWVIEYKVDGFYHVIERYTPEDEVKKFIILLMKVAKLKGYRIFIDYSRYDEY